MRGYFRPKWCHRWAAESENICFLLAAVLLKISHMMIFFREDSSRRDESNLILKIVCVAKKWPSHDYETAGHGVWRYVTIRQRFLKAKAAHINARKGGSAFPNGNEVFMDFQDDVTESVRRYYQRKCFWISFTNNLWVNKGWFPCPHAFTINLAFSFLSLAQPQARLHSWRDIWWLVCTKDGRRRKSW